MKITKTYNWNRRDFYFDAKCELCGNEEKEHGGYDDSNYYNNVVPNMKCGKCGESSNSKESSEPKSVIIPKYNPDTII